MYTALLHAHNGFRWLVLASIATYVVISFVGWLGGGNWKKSDSVLGLIATILIDIQFLIGLILYVISPLRQTAFQDFGAAMQNSTLRFFAVEHVVLMLLALALVHIGRSRTKKAVSYTKKHRTGAIFFSLALVLILAGIPWDRAFF